MHVRTSDILLIIILTQTSLITQTTKVGDEGVLSSIEIEQNQVEPDTDNNIFTAAAYARLFAERRKVHQTVVKELLASEKYEKNFKLLKLAYEKIFELIADKNTTLTNESYHPVRNGFPKSAHLQDAVTLILENCCIAAESLLHFPEISYRIFRKNSFANWKMTFNWCIDFVNSLTHLTDESTVKLMELLQQEVNENLRSSNYVNPYYKVRNDVEKTKRKQKKTTKLKNRPQLSGAKHEL